MERTRRNFSPEQKVNILREHLIERVPVVVHPIGERERRVAASLAVEAIGEVADPADGLDRGLERRPGEIELLAVMRREDEMA